MKNLISAHTFPQVVLYRGVLLSACCIVFAISSACNQIQQQLQQQSGSISGNSTATGASGTEQSNASVRRIAQTVRVNEAIIVVDIPAPTQEGKFLGKYTVEDMLHTLYPMRFKPEMLYDTLFIRDIQIAEVVGKERTYMAVIKTAAKRSTDAEHRIEVFAFKDTNSVHAVLGYAVYEPEYNDVDITSVTAGTYQITDKDYALAFEWSAEGVTGPNEEKYTMLCLFRLNDAVQPTSLQQLFEVCTFNKTGENVLESGYYGMLLQESATLATSKVWNKELYSLTVTRTQNRINSVDAGNTPPEVRKTKVVYQWDGARYVQANQIW